MSLHLHAFPAAVGLIFAGLLISLTSLGLLWRHQTQRAGHLLAASLWLTVWGTIINLGTLPIVASVIFASSIAAAYVWAMLRNLDEELSLDVQLPSGWMTQLAERLDDMLWLVSAETGTPLYVSPAYTQLTGKESIDLYSNPNAWRDMVHPEDQEKFADRFTGSAESSIDYRIINAQGESRWVRSHIWPHHDANGRVSAFAGITSDITDTFQQQADPVPHTQIQDRLGALADGVAHDFNNALFSLMGQASLAKAKLTDNHPARVHLDRMLAASDGAKQITQQMLTYAGNAPKETRRLNLNLVIQDNRKELKRSISRGVVLQTSLARFLPMVDADESQLTTVLQSLIENAVQAGARKIVISTAVQSASAENSFLTKDDGWQSYGDPLSTGDYVSVSIRDNGSGIDSDTELRMFEPYFTTNPEGIGLGLSTTLGIVRAHDGAIRVQSEVGVGSTFQLLLPVSRNKTVQVNEMNFVADDPKTQLASQVMIIDDEYTVTEVVSDLLELEGIQTITSNDGSTAVEMYRRQQANIGLVILDLTMPGMSGREVFQALREIDPNVNVLVSSGYGRKEVSRHITPDALAGIIQKPFDVYTLVSEIRSHL